MGVDMKMNIFGYISRGFTNMMGLLKFRRQTKGSISSLHEGELLQHKEVSMSESPDKRDDEKQTENTPKFEYDDGFQDWTLLEAVNEIEKAAWTKAVQLAGPSCTKDGLVRIVERIKAEMWAAVERRLKYDYPTIDWENFAYDLQEAAVEIDDDEDDDDEEDDSGIYVVELPTKEPTNEVVKKELDEVPSAADLFEWLEQ